MPEVPVDPDAERTRRRFVRRQWRRRWLAWRRVVAVLGALAVVGAGVYALYFSDWLSVHEVDVTGTETVAADEIREAARVPRGEALVRLDLSAIRARVEALADVRSADVSRRWPDGVLVKVVEREPLAAVEIAGTIRALDSEGVLFRSYRRPPRGLPFVKAGPRADSETLLEVATVVSALPGSIAGQVARLEVDTVDQIRLVLRDEREVRWGSAEESGLKADVLAVLLDQQAEVYDVSVPARPTTS